MSLKENAISEILAGVNQIALNVGFQNMFHEQFWKHRITFDVRCLAKLVEADLMFWRETLPLAII